MDGDLALEPLVSTCADNYPSVAPSFLQAGAAGCHWPQTAARFLCGARFVTNALRQRRLLRPARSAVAGSRWPVCKVGVRVVVNPEYVDPQIRTGQN